MRESECWYLNGLLLGDSCVETLDTRVVTPESVELRGPEPDPGQCWLETRAMWAGHRETQCGTNTRAKNIIRAKNRDIQWSWGVISDTIMWVMITKTLSAGGSVYCLETFYIGDLYPQHQASLVRIHSIQYILQILCEFWTNSYHWSTDYQISIYFILNMFALYSLYWNQKPIPWNCKMRS